jgi:hypothetical protein
MRNKSVTVGLLQQSRNKSLEQNLEATIHEIKESAKKGSSDYLSAGIISQ